MNVNNIVKIGTALKWRNEFAETTQYYQENIVACNGSVFVCKPTSSMGKCPVKVVDEDGHIELDNTDTWDVVLNHTWYYNYAIDNRKFTLETLAYIKELDEELHIQQGQIEDIQADNLNQWSHINDIEALNETQDGRLDAIDAVNRSQDERLVEVEQTNRRQDDDLDFLTTALANLEQRHQSDYDDILNRIQQQADKHDNDLAAVNEDITSKLAALTTNLTAQIAALRELIEGKITNLQNKVTELEEQIAKEADTNDKQQNAIDSLLTSFPFPGTGVWENDLPWNNDAYWSNIAMQNQMQAVGSVTVSDYDPETQTLSLYSPEDDDNE